MPLTTDEYEERIHRAHVGGEVLITVMQHFARDLRDLRETVARLECDLARARLNEPLNEPQYETKPAADGSGVFTQPVTEYADATGRNGD